MFAQFFTIGLLMLMSSMLPGPDFALVTKNTLLYSRRAGIYTSLGVGSAILVHITYCMLGLALVISQSIVAFNIIKYLGATYLIYLGIMSLLTPQRGSIANSTTRETTTIANLTAFRHGFLCNLLNPKATLFFLALFTVIIKPGTPLIWEIVYAVEMFVIITCWFIGLAFLLSHPRVLSALNKIEKYISKIVGVFLIGFGTVLAFVKQ